MTEQEKIAMHIAQCKICTLATIMKDCQHCPFKIGLVSQSNTVSIQKGK